MKPIIKGLVVAVLHLSLVALLGVKLIHDRATLPRVWVLSVPYDPNLPIRGRYVSLQIAVEPRGLQETEPGQAWQPPQSVVLHVEGDRLVAEAKPQERGHLPSDLHVRSIQRGDGTLTVLDKPIAFFIPEHVPDPSRRPQGEELWVQVTIPKKGAPRPIRLGVKQAEGPIVPLDFR